jgi:hypothetical protein
MEEGRKRKEKARQQEKEQVEHARQRMKEQEEHARQRKEEQEEQARQRKEEQEGQAPKARGKNKTFDDRMEDLKQYKETHGHINVSIRGQIPRPILCPNEVHT